MALDPMRHGPLQKHFEVQLTLRQHLCFHAHFTPTNASCLYQVQAGLSLLECRPNCRGELQSVAALHNAIQRFLAAWNDQRHPLSWSKGLTRSNQKFMSVTEYDLMDQLRVTWAWALEGQLAPPAVRVRVPTPNPGQHPLPALARHWRSRVWHPQALDQLELRAEILVAAADELASCRSVGGSHS